MSVNVASKCAVHFDAPSVATCRRCGRFCCASCLPQLELCTECSQRLANELPPLEGRATLAALGLWASAGTHGLMGLLAALQLGTGQLEETTPLAMASGVAALLYLVIFITTVVLVCMWFHRAARHALARGASLEVETPAGAVVSWFIPFLNLVRPFNLVRQMLSHAGQDSSQVGVWQALWIIGNISANLSNRIPGSGGLTVGVVSDLLLVGAGVASAGLVRKLKFA